MDYSPEFQDKAYLELTNLPPGSPLAAMMGDYKGLRDQVRACQDHN